MTTEQMVVPFCRDRVITSQRIEYGDVGWNPVTIPYCRELGIDTEAANRWLQSLRLSFSLTLGAFTDNSNEYTVTTAHQSTNHNHAQATVGTVTRQKPQHLLQLSQNFESPSQQINFNFQAMERQLAERNIQRSDSRFIPEFARLFNESLKKAAIPLVIFNNLYELKHDFGHFPEYFLFLINSAFTFLAEGAILGSMAAQGELTPESIAATTAALGLINLGAHNIVSLASLAMGRKFLDPAISKHGTEDETVGEAHFWYLAGREDLLLKHMIPLKPWRYLAIPAARAVLNRQTLIKPIQKL
ncbi:MAG: hypothetical protein WC775_02300 [Patescibacteria group bacterium]|jgi:hypothetical protein